MYSMMLVWQSVLTVLVLSIAAILVLIMYNHEFSFSHPLIIFSVFNTIIVASIVGSHKSPVHENEREMPFFSNLYGVEDAYYPVIIKENHKEEEKEVIYCMTQVWWSVLALLVLSIAAILVLIRNNHEFSFNHPLSIFSVFNTIIVASIVGSHKSPVHENEREMPFFSNLYGVEDAYDPVIIKENHKEEEEEGVICISDGHDEDDNNNGSGGEGDEYDENLERKIDEFIAKVIKRWREERLIENVRRPEVIGPEA